MSNINVGTDPNWPSAPVSNHPRQFARATTTKGKVSITTFAGAFSMTRYKDYGYFTPTSDQPAPLVNDPCTLSIAVSGTLVITAGVGSGVFTASGAILPRKNDVLTFVYNAYTWKALVDSIDATDATKATISTIPAALVAAGANGAATATFNWEARVISVAEGGVVSICPVPASIAVATSASASTTLVFHLNFNSMNVLGYKLPETENAGDVYVGASSVNSSQPLVVSAGDKSMIQLSQHTIDDLANWYMTTTEDEDGVVIELFQ
jgi:hypothetical protein